jgi:hypothetical protein
MLSGEMDDSLLMTAKGSAEFDILLVSNESEVELSSTNLNVSQLLSYLGFGKFTFFLLISLGKFWFLFLSLFSFSGPLTVLRPCVYGRLV